jgi:Ca2+-binding RTX toxin-like protein
MAFDFSNVKFFSDASGHGFDVYEQANIISIMRAAYTYSGKAKEMFDNWPKTINVHFSAGKFGAIPGTGNLYIDFAYLNDLTYINDKGKAVPASDLGAIIHELVHALTGRSDNISPTDYSGETVSFTNQIWAEMRGGSFGIVRFNDLDKQISYTASAYSSSGLQKSGYDYTNGTAIDAAYNVEQQRANGTNSIFNRGTGLTENDFSSIALGNSNDLLIGGSAINKLYSGAGNDFLFGGGENDILDGGAGKDTAVYFGNRSDYKIDRKDGSWIIRNTGTEGAGTDKLTNIEYAQFDGGLFNLGKETVELKKNGLTFQKDFALAIDLTASMGESIEDIKAQASSLIDSIFAEGIDVRFGIVAFRDTTYGQASQVILPFTDQDDVADRKSAALAAMNSLTVIGNGDAPETAFDGLKLALDGSMGEWRYGAGSRQIVLITDAPVKDKELAAEVTALSHSIGGTDPLDPDSTPAEVQISTIFAGQMGTEMAALSIPQLSEIASASGGTFVTAFDNDKFAKKLIGIVNPPNPIVGTLNADNLAGTSEDDTIYGLAGNDNIDGSDGDDTLYGDAGNDAIYGGMGKDNINGRDGDDTLYGDAGNDIVLGGVGNDTLYGGDGDDIVLGGVGNDTLYGGDGDDYINCDAGNNIIYGGAGADELYGGDGDNTLYGDAGNDNLYGGTGKETLYGGAGNDALYADAGNDTLYGDDGDDIIYGGAGVDRLFGGAGKDIFGYSSPIEGIDKINDFVVSDDLLRISMDGFGGSGTVGSEGVLDPSRFTLGSSATNSSQRFIYNNASGALFFDADGLGGAAQVRLAQLVGNPALTSANFYVLGNPPLN